MSAETNPLGVGPRVAQDQRVDQIIVQHDIGPPQALDTAQRDQTGITWARPDDVHSSNGFIHGRIGCSIVTGMFV